MSIEEIEAEALKLDPKARARLAGRLLESLEELSETENQQVWAEEARRRDAELDEDPSAGIGGDQVFRESRAKLN
jgi:putative addiction module component (TIGR02574 family)